MCCVYIAPRSTLRHNLWRQRLKTQARAQSRSTALKGFSCAQGKRYIFINNGLQHWIQALSEASRIVTDGLKERINAGHNNADISEKKVFFGELRKIRENWRIRKINNNLLGDLGYRICNYFNPKIVLLIFILDGQKFHSGELFEIFRRSLSKRALSIPDSPCLQVQVPRNLMRRTALWVSVQIGKE